MKYELIDVYDKHKNKTGRIVERKHGKKLAKGEYIIAVHCWIMNLDGKILLTQRKPGKKKGCLWEETAGLVKSGENSLQGIKRELKEEIGLAIEDKELTLAKEILEEREDVSFIRDIYVIKKDILISDLRFNDGEVVNAKYVTVDELKEMVKNGECAFYSYELIPFLV